MSIVSPSTRTLFMHVHVSMLSDFFFEEVQLIHFVERNRKQSKKKSFAFDVNTVYFVYIEIFAM